MLHSTSKITRDTLYIFADNPEIEPAFLNGTSVILTKDYTASDPYSHDTFTKNSVGTIQNGGLSIYGFDQEKRRFTILLDSNEWCFIELTGPHFEESEGCVMAKDLRLLTDEDLELSDDEDLELSDEDLEL